MMEDGRRLDRWAVVWQEQGNDLPFSFVTVISHLEVVEALDRRDAIDRVMAEHDGEVKYAMEEHEFMASWSPELSERFRETGRRLSAIEAAVTKLDHDEAVCRTVALVTFAVMAFVVALARALGL